MSEVNQSPATSPSKVIDDGAKKNWKGGLDHGTTSSSQALQSSPTKNPVTPPTTKR